MKYGHTGRVAECYNCEAHTFVWMHEKTSLPKEFQRLLKCQGWKIVRGFIFCPNCKPKAPTRL